MNETLGLGLVVLFFVMMVGFALLSRKKPLFRRIESFSVLPDTIGNAVEAGQRLHVSLGSGGLGGPESAAAYAGLAVLGRIAEVTTVSDRPPIVTTGNGLTAILAQDTLRAAYARQNAEERYEHTAGRMTGATPTSFAAGTMMVASEENAALNVLAGSFGTEGALIAHQGMAGEGHVLAGTDSPSANALLYAVADHPLIGEEMFAGGAYLEAGRMHAASIQAQDVLRWLIVGAAVIGALLKALGLL